MTTLIQSATSNEYEQTLLDDISDMFGPYIEDISIKQDVYHGVRQAAFLLDLNITPMISMDLDGLVAARNPGSTATQFVATMQVPVQRPRIHLGPSIRIQWLRELRIVFRATDERPFFLHAPTTNVSEEKLLPPSSTSSPPALPPILTMVDFSPCETLEVLSIEDFDQYGRPQQLRLMKAGIKAVNPFCQECGIKLPSRLKSLEMTGFSANRFNFGWLRATPRLERLQVLGMRQQQQQWFCQEDMDPETLDSHIQEESLWDWKGVLLPELTYLAVHHSPAFHFRFEILGQCPRLESLDIREIHPQVLGTTSRSDDEVVNTGTDIRSASTGTHGGGDSGVTSDGKPLLTRCRLEILSVQGEPLSLTTIDLARVLRAFLPNIIRLHVDGIPVWCLVEATSGPPTGSGSDSSSSLGSQCLHQLVHVLTREKMSAQDIADYDLVEPSTMRASCTAAMLSGTGQDVQAPSVVSIEEPDDGLYSIRYTIDGEDWKRTRATTAVCF
ncbi:hypothetical protein BGZ65_002202 [Modicella reniformis]|uniref:Uncharacterized protein n=1 Tax=Modicella reniformis TaxID=1440133 RepID=A0A9P6ML70_9FUNG|nr:hypothetical protein BGZ65_002202 [Modicella reniformis]